MVDKGANIDLFFRNGLKEFEVLPPSEVWDNIKPVIRKNQGSFIFLRVAAISLVFVSLGAISFLVTRNLSDKLNSPAISFNQDVIPEGAYVAKAEMVPSVIRAESPDISALSVSDNSELLSSEEEINFKLSEIGSYSAPVKKSSLQKNTIYYPLDKVSLNGTFNKSGINIDLLTEGKETIKSDKTAVRWGIGAQATPTFYSSFNTGTNSASKDLVDADKTAVSYSGGIAINYRVNKRISVQTGLYYSSFGQKVTGVSSFKGFSSYNQSKSGSDFSVRTSTGTIASSNKDIFLADNTNGSKVLTMYTNDVFDPNKANLQYLDKNVLQNFNYFEVPFLLKYKVIDRKIDFNLVGGISYNLLVSNSAYSVSGGVKYSIGKTEGLNPVALSSSLGMGMDYNLSSKISLNIEPTFRYYLTPVSAIVGSSIHSYSFGILSGFSYKF